MNRSEKKIIVCPLAWGIGHTTRMIPVIRKLMSANHNIIFAGNNWQIELIKNEIKGITCIPFPGFSIRYSSFLPQFVIILLHYPLFLYHTIAEHFKLNRIIDQYQPDIVISDSRIGLWNRKIKSVLITHIIRIPFPRPFRFLENLTLPISRSVIKKFTFCFIPDFPGEINLSGRLSHWCRLPENARYTGILSRFAASMKVFSPSEEPVPVYGEEKENVSPQNSQSNAYNSNNKDIFCTAIMSGPSPQKEILTSRIKDILLKLNKNSVILAGKPSGKYVLTDGNIRIINHLNETELADAISRSEIIVSRSGYTTVMELFSLGRSAILIPTPGQPEQEYLAEYLSEKKWFIRIKQNTLNINSLTEFSNLTLPVFNKPENDALLDAALKDLLKE